MKFLITGFCKNCNRNNETYHRNNLKTISDINKTRLYY